MKKNYKAPLFRAVFLSGKSSLMVGSGSEERPSGTIFETEGGFGGHTKTGGSQDEDYD